ncbi:MAG: 2-C-methyl-D-erythritol 4-phosphate cytidylyltransferase [Betaproteobacteria bacterium]|nr:2-C-methyl-D-erythritol 4-phosphate cytidylyltransferase [Betaproteobacteria bacterium]
MAEFFAVVAAAGVGRRLGGLAKQHRLLAGRPMLAHSTAALLADPRIRQVLVVVAAGDDQAAAALADFPAERVAVAAVGGPSRAATVAAGLGKCPAADSDIIVVHDAARPCLHREDLARLLDAAAESADGALLAAPVAATIKRGKDGASTATVDRRDLWEAMTPQAAPAALLRSVLSADSPATDEAQALEMAGRTPRLVPAGHPNPKVTEAADLQLAEWLLARAAAGP